MSDPVVHALPSPFRSALAPLARFNGTRWLKPVAFGLACLPIAWAIGAVVSDLFNGTRLLGTNPIKKAEHFTGEWALRFLLLSLAVTPLRQLFGWNWLASWRKMLGLFGFAMVVVHMLMWSVLDNELNLADIKDDLLDRWYIVIGMAAFLLLVPLAVTSTRGWIKRLGKRWVTLHLLVFPAVALALVHFVMAQKKDFEDPALFAAFAVALVAWRVWRRRAAA
jgi:methionine sulfoxide reductase heme-binding subunit